MITQFFQLLQEISYKVTVNHWLVAFPLRKPLLIFLFFDSIQARLFQLKHLN